MFDYRYHALSLAAVLFALAVGVLIGVAIGDSNLVSSARDGIVANLRSEVSGSQGRADALSAKLGSEEALAAGLYPLAVHGLLGGRNIGLVFLGSSSDQIDGYVRQAVTQAGGNLKTVVAVREPLDLAGIGSEAGGTQYAALGSTPALVHRFGLRMGAQLVGEGQLLARVQARLLSSYDGQLGRLGGLVVVRDEPSGMSAEAAASAAAFESGLLAGVGSRRVRAVGVELTSTQPSQVPWFSGNGLASVDDLDTLAGQAALAFALAGDRGAYGVKSTAGALLPRVPGAGAP